MKYVPAYGQLGDQARAETYWQKCIELEDGWSTDSVIAVWRLWNFRQEDIDVLMDGVRKAGI